MVSAWSAANGISLGQVKVDDKNNEITAVSEFLNIMGIKGKIIAPIQCDTRKTSLRR